MVLEIAGAIFVPLILLLILVLSLPVAFSGLFHWAEKPSGQGELAWAWGLARAKVYVGAGGPAGAKPGVALRLGPLPWFTPGSKPHRAARPRRRERPARKRAAHRSGAHWLASLDERIFGAAISFLRSTVRSLRLRLRLEGEYGTNDPDLTGYLSALVAVAAGGPLQLNLTPAFGEPRVDIRGELRGCLVPAQLLWISARFILSPPVRRKWWTMLTRRKAKS